MSKGMEYPSTHPHPTKSIGRPLSVSLSLALVAGRQQKGRGILVSDNPSRPYRWGRGPIARYVVGATCILEDIHSICTEERASRFAAPRVTGRQPALFKPGEPYPASASRSSFAPICFVVSRQIPPPLAHFETPQRQLLDGQSNLPVRVPYPAPLAQHTHSASLVALMQRPESSVALAQRCRCAPARSTIHILLYPPCPHPALFLVEH